MIINAKILICYNSPVSVFSIYNGNPNNNKLSTNDLSEIGFSKEISNIEENLSQYYSNIKTLSIDRNLEKSISEINDFSPDVIFNFVESIEGIASYEYCMAGVFQLLGFNFTGNLPSTLGNCLDKNRTKSILRSYGINTPNSIIVSPSIYLNEAEFDLKFPVIVKLLKEDASIGISEYSVVSDLSSLKNQLKFLLDTYKQNVIIEEYIDGRELNAAILGNTVLPISEIDFSGLPDHLPKIVTYDGKWIEDSLYYNYTKPICPANLNNGLKNKIEKTAMLAFEALNCRDYARVDIRLNKNGEPYVIEVNPNPDISIDSGFARAAKAAGISYGMLLNNIANFALSREKNDSQNKAS